MAPRHRVDVIQSDTGEIRALAVGAIDSQPILIAAHFGTLQIWDLRTREQTGQPLTGHTGVVHAATMAVVGNLDVVISTGDDATVRIWDISTHQQIDQFTLPEVGNAITMLGNDIVVAFGNDIACFAGPTRKDEED